MEITELTAFDLGRKIMARELSATEAAEACFDRIARTEPAVDAYLRLTEDNVRKPEF